MSEEKGLHVEPELGPDQRRDNPISDFSVDKIKELVDDLYDRKFKKKSSTANTANTTNTTNAANTTDTTNTANAANAANTASTDSTVSIVSYKDLLTGAAHAKYYLRHDDAKKESVKVLTDDEEISPLAGVGRLLGEREWKAYKTQKDAKFWHEPKDLLVTLIACCLASFTQGWDQVANGNLGWPGAFDLDINPSGWGGKDGGTGDFWIVGGVNCITWFSAAFLGPFFVDPLAQFTSRLGRRGAVLIAASFSLASMIGGSRSTSWQGYFIARLFLGIGIGAKASLVPIWESEVLPPAKRGRLLVSWQFFTATGIFAGSVATYIFRDYWRTQILSGALPALILLIVTYFGTESPRYLILHGKYEEAFTSLLRLRRERILAAEELFYIHILIQAERIGSAQELTTEKLKHDYTPPSNLGLLKKCFGRLKSYYRRLRSILKVERNKHAAIATMVVMLSQQLSGINILGFVSSIFFSAAGLRKQPDPDDGAKNLANAYDSLRFTIGFGAANALFSAIAYFLIEPVKESPNMQGGALHEMRASPEEKAKHEKEKASSTRSYRKLFFGRRALLMGSLGGGALMLFILTFLLRLDESSDAKLPLVMIFIILWTFFYSPGAGAVPFLYSAEVWPNEGREVGMSWAVFWNFFGAGFLALFVPRGLKWGPSKLFGLFTGLSVLGVILVYLFVPGTDRATSLDDMSKKFDKENYREFNKEKMKTLVNPTRLGKKSSIKSQQEAQSAQTQGTPTGLGVPTQQGAPGGPTQTAASSIIQQDSDSDDDEGADPQPNLTEGQTHGTSAPTGTGQPNPTGESQALRNTSTPTGTA